MSARELHTQLQSARFSRLIHVLPGKKDNVGVEHTLRTKANPIGVAAYAMLSKLPGELKGKLPAAKKLADIVLAEMEGGK